MISLFREGISMKSESEIREMLAELAIMEAEGNLDAYEDAEITGKKKALAWVLSTEDIR